MVAPLDIKERDYVGAYAEGMKIGEAYRQRKRDDRTREGLGRYLSAGDRAGLDVAYQNDPDAAFKAQQAVQKQQGDAQTVAANFAKAWSAAPPQAKPNLISAARRTIAQRPDLQQVLGDQLPQTDDPAEWDNFLGQGALFDGGGVGGTVQSTFVDDQGNRVAIMRDGSKQIIGANAPNNQIMEAAGGIYGINKGNLRAAPVMLGGAPQPQAQPTAIDTSIDINSLPPGEREAAMMAAQGQDAHVVNGVAVPGNTLEAQQMGARGPQQAMPQGQQLQAAPKQAAPEKPTELASRITLAKQMGATDEEIKRMVVGGSAARDAQPVSAKDMTTAKLKINQIKAARQMLQAVKDRFGKIKGTFSAGVGGDYLPTEEGQKFDRAVRNLAPLITAVTRVPGVGAMSDYESRLAEAGLPSRGTYEGSTEQQIADLENLLNTVESGYTDLIGGSSAPAPAAAGGGWSATRVK